LQIAHKALGQQEIACGVAQPFAIGAHGVKVQKSVLDLALLKPSDPQMARQHCVHFKIGEIANNDRGR
jgi:hypothetical protein